MGPALSCWNGKAPFPKWTAAQQAHMNVRGWYMHLATEWSWILPPWVSELSNVKTECVVPFGHSLLQLSEQVLIEFVELWEVVEDLVEEMVLNHRLPVLLGRFGYSSTEVLGEKQWKTDKESGERIQELKTHMGNRSVALSGSRIPGSIW